MCKRDLGKADVQCTPNIFFYEITFSIVLSQLSLFHELPEYVINSSCLPHTWKGRRILRSKKRGECKMF